VKKLGYLSFNIDFGKLGIDCSFVTNRTDATILGLSLMDD